jgi:hypothetical protein
VFALSAAVAASASASGPLWYVKKAGLAERLPVGTSVGVESTGVVVEFKLKTSIKATTGVIKCSVLTVSSATITGASPGTDKSTEEFSKCKGEGFAALCEVKSATGVKEVIGPFNVATTLVFQEGVRNHALDRFLPEAGTTFVSFELAGTLCPNKGKVHVEGCVLAELWQAGAASTSGALAKENELNFPEPSLEKYEIENGSVFESKTCKLTSKFEAEAGTAATQVGRAKLGLTAAAKTAGYEEFGWIEK